MFVLLARFPYKCKSLYHLLDVGEEIVHAETCKSFKACGKSEAVLDIVFSQYPPNVINLARDAYNLSKKSKGIIFQLLILETTVEEFETYVTRGIFPEYKKPCTEMEWL